MSVKGSTVAMKAVVGGSRPSFLGTPEDFQALNGQFLGFGEMVELTGRKNSPPKLLVCIEVGLQADRMWGCCEETWFPSPGFHMSSVAHPPVGGNMDRAWLSHNAPM